jgi:hypothetical protein
MIIFLSGCSAQKAYNRYGGMQNNLNTNIVFYGQYEIMYKQHDRIHVNPFLSNSNSYLPDETIKLHFGLSVNNPSREYFEVWIEARFIELDTNNLFQLTKYVYVTRKLPEEFISIPLPRDIYTRSQVEFWVSVMSKEKDVLYQSSKVFYKIGKQK